jgi:hypothetical protein
MRKRSMAASARRTSFRRAATISMGNTGRHFLDLKLSCWRAAGRARTYTRRALRLTVPYKEPTTCSLTSRRVLLAARSISLGQAL